MSRLKPVNICMNVLFKYVRAKTFALEYMYVGCYFQPLACYRNLDRLVTTVEYDTIIKPKSQGSEL